MIYVYELKNRRFSVYDEMKEEVKIIKLTPLEHKYLIALSDIHTVPLKKISNFIYGYYDSASANSIYRLKKRFLKKVNLKIKNLYGRGYKLENTIYFR